MIRAACVALFLCAVLRPAAAAEPLKVPIGYLVRPETIETISLLDQPAANNGIAGAQLAVQDNNTTGRFLNQSFSLEAIKLADGADPATAATSKPGIFAVGDVVHYPGKLKLILTGFAEAAIAARSAYALIHPETPLHFEYSTTSGLPSV